MKSGSYVKTPGPPRQAQSKGCAEVCGQVCEVEVIHADAVRAARSALPSASEQASLSGLFALFSNATRLNLLLALRASQSRAPAELCVCDLIAITGASQSMVSHQLGLLRDANLVTSRRVGRLVYYSLAAGPLADLLDGALRYVRKEAA